MPLIADVIAGQIIQSAWGNSMRDRTRGIFATVAELNSTWPSPPNGAHAITMDTGTHWDRIAGAWVSAGGSPAWLTLLPLANGWTPFPGNYMSPAYRRIGDRVELSGLVIPGAFSVNLSSVALPVPKGQVLMAALTEVSGTPAVSRVFVAATGGLGATNGATFVSLNGLSYSTLAPSTT